MRYLPVCMLVFLTACNSSSGSVALGTLERDRIAHTATAAEIVVQLPVAQGSKVSKGMVLVKLDDTMQKAQVLRAKAEVTQAKANLEKLQTGARKEEIADARAQVEGAEARVIEAKANYDRERDLAKKGLASKATLDKSRAERDASFANLKSAKEKLRVLTSGTRIEDLRIAEARLAVANATLSLENKRLRDLTVTATRNGTLDSLPWNLGERVTAGSPVAIVLAGDAPHARVYIPEPWRAKLKVGAKLIVHVDGVEKAMSGKLRWISSEPAFTPYYALNQQESSRLMYLAEVQLPVSDTNLPSGLPAKVELP